MIKLYNSLTRAKEELLLSDGVVRMYSCGPTVYNYPHIGNMRAYLFMDALRRVLKYNGLKIDGVMNITDVGHMTSDEDEGEDKMLVASQREHKTPEEIAKYYTDVFMGEMKKLNIDMPEHICPATSVIPEIIVFVKTLLEKGHAYETSKGIYFDIANARRFGSPEQWIRTLGKRILSFHCKDYRMSLDNINAFTNLLDGDVNYPAVIEAIREIGYDGDLVVELTPPAHYLVENTLAYALGTLKDLLKS